MLLIKNEKKKISDFDFECKKYVFKIVKHRSEKLTSLDLNERTNILNLEKYKELIIKGFKVI